MVMSFPPCPDSLKTIQPYLKVAAEHDEKDPVVSYWCRLYSLQAALTIDKKSDEAKRLLLPLMDWLEKTKKTIDASESITSEVAAQAYIENYALKLFLWADNKDRSGIFNKNVVRSFYVSGLLFDVMSIFGELNEDLINNRKYAKWKATYINNCLKNGEVPIAGPLSDDTSTPNTSPNNLRSHEEREFNELMKIDRNTNPTIPNNSYSTSSHSFPSHLPIPPSNSVPQAAEMSETSSHYDGVKLNSSQVAKAQKYCKFAMSALNYDDFKEAVMNLEKALKLLQTGVDE